MSCTICEYAAEHACWPPDHQGTHCKDCHRDWRGVAEIHCVTCHRHFSCDATLELHKHGHECVDPAGLRRQDGSPVFRVRESPHGVVWVRLEERDPPRPVSDAASEAA